MRPTALFILAACAGGGETATAPGNLALCVDGPGVTLDTRATWLVSGTVTALGDELPRGDTLINGCSFLPGGKSMLVTDADGADWTFGWTATAGSGDESQPMTPTLDVAVGDALDIEVRAWHDFAEEHDIMIRDADGVVFAAAEGWYTEVWAEVASGAGLTVSDGGALRPLGDDGCGRRSTHMLTFEADNTLTLDIWVEGTVAWDGEPLQARNVGAWSFDGQVSCTDTWGPAPWMVFREP